jgi:pyridoxal phosphate enzyme (YggS family)
LPIESTCLSERLALVETRIQNAVERSGRMRSEITLVAVTKKFSAQTIRQAYAAGLRVFGENYVQEWAEKRDAVGRLDAPQFHLIGHLQSNKAKVAVELFDAVQTVDSSRLLRRLDAAAAELAGPFEVLLELKLSTEESKAGASPQELPELLETARACPHLRVSGLMTIPPWSEDPEHSRPYFQQLATLARQHALPKLSMGMSADFEVAIEEGATLIRLGTALFGSRPKPAPVDPPASE